MYLIISFYYFQTGLLDNQLPKNNRLYFQQPHWNTSNVSVGDDVVAADASNNNNNNQNNNNIYLDDDLKLHPQQQRQQHQQLQLQMLQPPASSVRRRRHLRSTRDFGGGGISVVCVDHEDEELTPEVSDIADLSDDGLEDFDECGDITVTTPVLMNTIDTLDSSFRPTATTTGRAASASASVTDINSPDRISHIERISSPNGG